MKILTFHFLKNIRQKLLALKDLYKQDLINAELYENKIDLITKRVEEILGDEFDSLPNFQQKVIMDTLKEDIKTKIKIIPSVKRENNIDNLIQAVDSRINKEKIYEEKNSEIIDEVKKSVDASKPMKRKINNKLSEEKIKEEKLIKSIVDDWIAENAKTISKEILKKIKVFLNNFILYDSRNILKIILDKHFSYLKIKIIFFD